MKKHEQNCQNCKHYRRGRITFYAPETHRYCAAGHNVEMTKWWEENGHLSPSSPLFSEMKCFEPHPSLVMLDSILDKADEVLQKLDKK